jgi:hypothetical protein
MTEYEQLVAWLTRVNLPHVTILHTWESRVEWIDGVATHVQTIEGCPTILLGDDIEWQARGRYVEPSATYVPGNEELADGYNYFYHRFVFHPDGHLLESSTWE